MTDSGWRPGHDPWELQARAESDRKVHEAERRHPGPGGSAADARSLRAWLPILVILLGVLVVLVVLSLPR